MGKSNSSIQINEELNLNDMKNKYLDKVVYVYPLKQFYQVVKVENNLMYINEEVGFEECEIALSIN